MQQDNCKDSGNEQANKKTGSVEGYFWQANTHSLNCTTCADSAYVNWVSEIVIIFV